MRFILPLLHFWYHVFFWTIHLCVKVLPVFALFSNFLLPAASGMSNKIHQLFEKRWRFLSLLLLKQNVGFVFVFFFFWWGEHVLQFEEDAKNFLFPINEGRKLTDKTGLIKLKDSSNKRGNQTINVCFITRLCLNKDSFSSDTFWTHLLQLDHLILTLSSSARFCLSSGGLPLTVGYCQQISKPSKWRSRKNLIVVVTKTFRICFAATA